MDSASCWRATQQHWAWLERPQQQVLCWVLEMKVRNVLTCVDQCIVSEVRQEGGCLRFRRNLCWRLRWAPALCGSGTGWRPMWLLALSPMLTCCTGTSSRMKAQPYRPPLGFRHRALRDWLVVHWAHVKIYTSDVARSGTYYFVKRSRWHTKICRPDVDERQVQP